MGIVVAIGGMTKDIESVKNICGEIIALAKKKNTRVLYVPTANNDHEEYSRIMANFFKKNYTCNVDTLWLVNNVDNEKTINEKIQKADAIFVEGGNSLKLLEIWREKNIEDKLRTAYENGVILSGISAGANCWFEYFYSDSVDGKKYALVKGLGIVKGCICPHYNNIERKSSFENEKKIKENQLRPVYRIEENSAVIIENGKDRKITIV